MIDRDELLSVFPGPRATRRRCCGQLVDARLLTSYEVEGAEGEPSRHRVEIVHESLLKAWPRLVRWQTQDEEGRGPARPAQAGGAPVGGEGADAGDLLWTGTAFQEYELWRGALPRRAHRRRGGLREGDGRRGPCGEAACGDGRGRRAWRPPRRGGACRRALARERGVAGPRAEAASSSPWAGRAGPLPDGRRSPTRRKSLEPRTRAARRLRGRGPLALADRAPPAAGTRRLARGLQPRRPLARRHSRSRAASCCSKTKAVPPRILQDQPSDGLSATHPLHPRRRGPFSPSHWMRPVSTCNKRADGREIRRFEPEPPGGYGVIPRPKPGSANVLPMWTPLPQGILFQWAPLREGVPVPPAPGLREPFGVWPYDGGSLTPSDRCATPRTLMGSTLAGHGFS